MSHSQGNILMSDWASLSSWTSVSPPLRQTTKHWHKDMAAWVTWRRSFGEGQSDYKAYMFAGDVLSYFMFSSREPFRGSDPSCDHPGCRECGDKFLGTDWLMIVATSS